MNQTAEDSEILKCYTTIAWRILLADDQRTAIASILGLLMPSTILLNVGLCIALYKTGQLKSPSKFLFFWLCLSDCFMGIFTVPMSVLTFSLFGNKRNCSFEYTYMFIGQMNGHLSLYLILAVALQRYLVMKNTIKARFLLTKSAAWYLVIASFVLALSHGFVSSYFFGLVKTKLPNTILMIIRALITITIYVLYFRLYLSVRRHVKSSPIRNNRRQATDVKEKFILKSQDHVPKFFITVLLIMVSLALCYLPVVLTDLWTGYYSLIKKKPSAAPLTLRFAYYLLYAPVFFNSTLNAAIFLYRNKECQGYLKKAIECTRFKNKNRQPTLTTPQPTGLEIEEAM